MGIAGQDERVASPGRERMMLVGALATGTGGLLLASSFVASPPGAVSALGLALFVGGVGAIGSAGGWREAWAAFKALLP